MSAFIKRAKDSDHVNMAIVVGLTMFLLINAGLQFAVVFGLLEM